MPTPPKTATELLLAWSQGDSAALDRLGPLVYEELRRQAYLRLVDQHETDWKNRAHFFGVPAQMMRRVLIDHARSKQAAKRGGGEVQVTPNDAEVAANARGIDLLELDEAITRLGALDAQRARLVELRYFTGLSIEETAEALGTSPATVKREWALARAWLRRELAH